MMATDTHNRWRDEGADCTRRHCDGNLSRSTRCGSRQPEGSPAPRLLSAEDRLVSDALDQLGSTAGYRSENRREVIPRPWLQVGWWGCSRCSAVGIIRLRDLEGHQ